MRGDGGQWMRDAARRDVMSLLGALVTVKLARLALVYRQFNPQQLRDDIGRWVHVGAGSDLTGSIVNRGETTGNTKIDDTTDFLTETMKDAIGRLGDGGGHVYGSAVHSEIANAVRASNRPGLSVEDSFRLGNIVPYGLGGSVRTDVILRDQFGEISAVWDIKTGGAVLSRSRVNDLRQELNIGRDVPVIQLHQFLGSSIKALTTSGA